jgi:thiosulfate/3-mercaptopyruvate sulfurtransferase
MVSVLGFVTALGVAGTAVCGEGYKGFERGEALITPGELRALMDARDPKLVVIGVVKGGAKGFFALGHIPGAYGVGRSDFTAPAGRPHPFGGMMVNRAEFQDFARRLGINDDSKVVLYDHKYDAARLWWGFFLYGKSDVRILDGGYAGWKAAGFDTEMGSGAQTNTRIGGWVAKPRRPGWVWSMSDVWRAKSNDEIQLWDTREPDEWTGEKLKKGASRRGRIGWAKFLSWKDFRKKVGGDPTEFRNSAEIQRVIDDNGMRPNADQLFHCQSGVRTTTHIFALYLMGWDLARLHNYDGSWIEWSYHEKNPVVTGE